MEPVEISVTAKTDSALWRSALVILALSLILLLPEGEALPALYFREQDLPAALAMVATLGLAGWWLPQIRLPDRAPRPGVVALITIMLALGLWAGTYLIMFDYPLTRDEHMVVFDAHIFASGKFAAPLAQEWRGFSEALVPAFLLELPGEEILVSSYMPGNAMMRAVFGMLADPALMNPLLFAIGFVTLYDIACRLFADTPAAIWPVMLAYLLSAQGLVTAMTAYAMTPHLALNLVWLGLFLRGRWWQHALAMLIGAWAIGLHQVVFHPLFAGPIILMLLWQKRWALFGVYALVYGAALLFWLAYPSLLVSSLGIVTEGTANADIEAIWMERVWPLLSQRDPRTIVYMEFNLLRFIVWAPLFLLPLLGFAWPLIRKGTGLNLALFGGIFLTLAAMIVLLPYQGHGWGYRYWHGLIGNFALLAGYGYAEWARRDRKIADGAVVFLSGVTTVFLVPFLLWCSYSFTKPYADLTQLISKQTSDFLIVDTDTHRGAVDQIRNLPDLSNRPLIFASHALTGSMLAKLCERGSISLIDNNAFAAADFHQKLADLPKDKFALRMSPLAGKPCLTPPVLEGA